MYLDIGLCGVIVGLVLEIERVEPLVLRKVESKVQVRTTLDCFCQCTCITLKG